MLRGRIGDRPQIKNRPALLSDIVSYVIQFYHSMRESGISPIYAMTFSPNYPISIKVNADHSMPRLSKTALLQK